MIKAIFFDFDGVLTLDVQGRFTTCRYVSKYTGVPFEKVESCYRSLSGDVYIGKKEHKDILDDFCSCIGFDFPLEVFNEAFVSTPANLEIFDLCRQLKSKYKLGIITENGIDRFEAVRSEMKLDDLFEATSLSADVGVWKDDPRLFEGALELLGVEAQESVFIDNKQKNLDLPKAMGFHTYYHDIEKNDVNMLKKSLTEMGVIIPV